MAEAIQFLKRRTIVEVKYYWLNLERIRWVSFNRNSLVH
jgi:hypothetical protein